MHPYSEYLHWCLYQVSDSVCCDMRRPSNPALLGLCASIFRKRPQELTKRTVSSPDHWLPNNLTPVVCVQSLAYKGPVMRDDWMDEEREESGRVNYMWAVTQEVLTSLKKRMWEALIYLTQPFTNTFTFYEANGRKCCCTEPSGFIEVNPVSPFTAMFGQERPSLYEPLVFPAARGK